jgi:hypothetical protein
VSLGLRQVVWGGKMEEEGRGGFGDEMRDGEGWLLFITTEN